MELPIAAGIVALIGLALVRFYDGRPVAPDRGAFAWLLVSPMLVSAVAITWIGVTIWSAAPAAGALLLAWGSIHIAVAGRMLVRMSRSGRARPSWPAEDDGTGPTGAPATPAQAGQGMFTMLGVLLVGALIGIAGLALWAVAVVTR